MKPVLSEEFMQSLAEDVKRLIGEGKELIGTGIQVTVLLKVQEMGLEILDQTIEGGEIVEGKEDE
jgi:hypothetical protein